MSEAAAYFDKLKKGLVGGLNTVAIGQIEVFDPLKMRADVKILPGGGLIKSVPVASLQNGDFLIRVPYKKGDHVLIVFAQRDIDAIMYGGDQQPSKRMLAIDDALVVGGINLFTHSTTGSNTNDLFIGKKDGSAKITISSSGAITLDAPNGLTINGKDRNESW